VKYLKTTLTTKTEAALVKEGIELKAQASAAFDGFTGGTNFDVKQTWGDQAEPAAIFLDLRPANELLNPILLPWSADPLATTEEIQAPFLWYLLRQSWRDYQRRIHQIDASISTLPDKDWSPKIVRFHGEAKLAKTDEWEGWFEDRIYGRTKWRPYGTPLVAESVDYYRSAANSQGCLSGLIPGTEISCMLVADSTTATGAGVALRALPRSHARLFATRTTRPDSDGDAEDCVFDVFEPVGAPVPYGEPGRRTVYRQGVIVTTAPLPNTSVEAYRTPWAYSTAAGCDSGIVSTVVPPWTTAISSAKSSLT
jgi:hypothetical protein